MIEISKGSIKVLRKKKEGLNSKAKDLNIQCQAIILHLQFILKGSKKLEIHVNRQNVFAISRNLLYNIQISSKKSTFQKYPQTENVLKQSQDWTQSNCKENLRILSISKSNKKKLVDTDLLKEKVATEQGGRGCGQITIKIG